MADAKITINNLPNEITTLEDADLFAAWDDSASTTAKVSAATIKSSLVSPAIATEATNRINDVADLQAQVDLKAPIDSAAFTGTPTAPTAATVTDDATLATTAFVHNVVDAASGAVVSVNGETGAVVIDAADVGLGGFTGLTPATLPLSTASVGALAAKEPSITVGTVAQYWRGDKTFQPVSGLPVSTAQQTAIDGKVENVIDSTHTAIAPSGQAVNAQVTGNTSKLYDVDVLDYMAGAWTYLNPLTAVTESARAAATNIYTALQAAVTAMSNRIIAGQRSGFVLLPPGVNNVEGSIAGDKILVPSGVRIKGRGQGVAATATHLRCAGDLGDVFEFQGFNSGISDCLIYQDHGGTNNYGYQGPATNYFIGDGAVTVFDAPQTPANLAALYIQVNGTTLTATTDYTWTPGSAAVTFVVAPALNAKIYIAIGQFKNKATTGSLILATNCRFGIFERLSLWGKPACLTVKGGQGNIFRDIDTNGIWDPDMSTRQESVYGVIQDLGTGIPTWNLYENVRTGGFGKVTPFYRVASTLTVCASANKVKAVYPGGGTLDTQVNIGSQYGFMQLCGEETYYRGCNFSAAQKSEAVIKSSSAANYINQGTTYDQCVFSPCGTDIADAGLKFENADAGGQISGVVVSGCEWLGQGNGYRAISDYGSTATNGSVVGLHVTGTISTYVGNAIRLERARSAVIDVAVRDYNRLNLYTGDDACAVYAGSNCNGVSVFGSLGGSTTGAATGSFCIDGVRAANATASNVQCYAANTGMSGNVFLSAGSPVLLPINVRNVITVNDASKTLTWGTDAPVQWVIGAATATRTFTLATVDKDGAPIPDGATFTVIHDPVAVGTFGYILGGQVIYTNQWAEVFCFGGAWRQGRSGFVGKPKSVLSTPTTGSTLTIAAGTVYQKIGGTIAALTLAVPVGLYDGQALTISIADAITTLTYTGATFKKTPPATVSASGVVIALVWDTGTASWWNA